MEKQNKKWFTLVELIVVITILAILATIAFISFQWYSTWPRDAKRSSDISNLMLLIEIWWNKGKTLWEMIIEEKI